MKYYTIKMRKQPKHSGRLSVKFKVQLDTRVSDSYSTNKLATVAQLKEIAELATGICTDIQRVHYLDKGELSNTGLLQDYDVVPGAIFIVDMWSEWHSLIDAILLGDINQVFQLGVATDSACMYPLLEDMNGEERKQWLRRRGYVALYLAVHRGQVELCKSLIESGVDINKKSASGRCPLHMAAATGQAAVLKYLLHAGADISLTDRNGMTAVQLAKHYNHKSCEQHLVQFAFGLRARNSRRTEYPMFAHQYFDSSLKPYLQSDHAQMYLQQLLPPGEYGGTSLNAPRRKIKRPNTRQSDSTESDNKHFT